MIKKELLYEGKAKKVFATDDPNRCIVSYKDDATAFNGLKKGEIEGKGAVNNRVTNYFMKLLEKEGVKTHFAEELSDRETVVKKVKIIPLEVIVRNIAAGSMSKRLGIEEGLILKKPVVELSYKNDDLGDPLINDDHALALNAATEDELAKIKTLALKVNDILKDRLLKAGVILVDFKLEFGAHSTEGILLADEISPDTCRFWDEKTKEKLDKDRFRRDMTDVGRGYSEISARLGLREA
ncbi:MAG: phosphoribosylaminoimidazolesuccinocarboxamide synthase [Clostridiales bacterium]|nr:phosphoribosylaminoimidazolesuccinocarboxamide synthase [Clostridiales bacterium]